MASEEYPVWEAYRERLQEADLEAEVVREIIDMMITQTVNEGRLEAALEAQELRIAERISASAETHEQALEARVSQAIQSQTKWMLTTMVTLMFGAAGLAVAVLRLIS